MYIGLVASQYALNPKGNWCGTTLHVCVRVCWRQLVCKIDTLTDLEDAACFFSRPYHLVA